MSVEVRAAQGIIILEGTKFFLNGNNQIIALKYEPKSLNTVKRSSYFRIFVLKKDKL